MSAGFQDQVDFAAAQEEPVGWQDIGMLAVQLDLHLVNEKLNGHLRLIEALQDNQHLSGLGHSQVNRPILPLG